MYQPPQHTNMAQAIRFIINPISGAGRGRQLPPLIEQHLDHQRYQPEVCFTNARGHATQLATEAVAQDIPYVVAVGGDGTVNEVARALVHSQTTLGIIPQGSGNGFARHLGITPNKPLLALETINRCNAQPVDYGTLNGHPFFCTAGVGFDAVMGDRFVRLQKRGFVSYLRTVLQCYFGYKAERYTIQLDDGQTIEKEAFLITLANAAQWGYGIRIAPKAEVHDGQLDITLAARFPLWRTLGMALRLLCGRIDSSRYVSSLRTRHITISRKAQGVAHVDGEPFDMQPLLEAECHHQALHVLMP